MVLWGSQQHPLLLNCPPPRLEAAPCPPDVPLAPEIPSPGGSLHLTRSARLCHYVATDTKPAVNTRWREEYGKWYGKCTENGQRGGLDHWDCGSWLRAGWLVVSNSHATDSCLPVEAQKPRLSQRLGQASESRNLRAGAGVRLGGAYGLGCAYGLWWCLRVGMVTPSRSGHQPGDSKGSGELGYELGYGLGYGLGYELGSNERNRILTLVPTLLSNPSFRPSFRRLRVTRSLGLPVVFLYTARGLSSKFFSAMAKKDRRVPTGKYNDEKTIQIKQLSLS